MSGESGLALLDQMSSVRAKREGRLRRTAPPPGNDLIGGMFLVSIRLLRRGLGPHSPGRVDAVDFLPNGIGPLLRRQNIPT